METGPVADFQNQFKGRFKIMNFILPEARMDILGWVASLSDKISIFRTAPAPRET